MTKRDLDLNDTPVVFPYKGRDLLAGSGKRGTPVPVGLQIARR
jgi:hypothetical protein